MKKLLLGLSLVALLAGCASQGNNSGMGGTSDTYDSSSGVRYNNNATHGTGATTAPNNGTEMGP